MGEGTYAYPGKDQNEGEKVGTKKNKFCIGGMTRVSEIATYILFNECMELHTHTQINQGITFLGG